MNMRASSLRVPGLLLMAVAPLAGCGDPEAAPPADPMPVTASLDSATLSAEAVQIAGFTVDTVVSRPWQTSVTVPGRLELDPSALETIGSITEGRITRVTVRVGDRVSAGQALVMIHSHEIMDARSRFTSATAQVTAMEAERDLARTAAERARRLLENKAMSTAEVERADVARKVAQANYEQAMAERDRAEALIEHLAGLGPLPAGADEHDVIIRTPIAGVVTSRDAQAGTVVLPGTPLITVGNPDRLQIGMHLPEQAAVGVRPGATVRYALTESPTDRFDAVVVRVAPTVDTLSRTVAVVAQLRGRTTGRAESFVQADIEGQGTASALVVPARAVQAMQGDTVVFLAEPRGEGLFIQAMPVRVGRRTTDRVELLGGVPQGTAVVVNGSAIAKAELLKRRGGGE